MLMDIIDEGPLMGGLEVRLETPSEVLLILAIAPRTQAFICLLPLELVVSFSPPGQCYFCLYLILRNKKIKIMLIVKAIKIFKVGKLIIFCHNKKQKAKIFASM
jgi:hypothetical protein